MLFNVEEARRSNFNTATIKQLNKCATNGTSTENGSARESDDLGPLQKSLLPGVAGDQARDPGD